MSIWYVLLKSNLSLHYNSFSGALLDFSWDKQVKPFHITPFAPMGVCTGKKIPKKASYIVDFSGMQKDVGTSIDGDSKHCKWICTPCV